MGHPSKKELERINEVCQVSKVTPVQDCSQLDFGGLIDIYFFLLETGDQMREKGAENANCLKKHGILYFICGSALFMYLLCACDFP